MVSNKVFLEGRDVPKLHAVTRAYERNLWWKTQTRRCIEGFWSSGKWMPGTLYYYVNFHKIKVRDPQTRGHKVGLPFLRDIEWEKAYIYEEASGFSGFKDDPIYTCNKAVLDHIDNGGELDSEQLRLKYAYDQQTGKTIKHIYNNLFNELGQLKQFVPAREYLRRIYTVNMGKPVYYNICSNVIDLEARGGGKSFWASCLIAHNFIFDGAVDFDLWVSARLANHPLTSDTVVGAIHSKYSSDLLNKVLLAFDHFPDIQEINGKTYYPKIHPFWKGSLYSGKQKITSTRSGSVLNHITFSDDPLAANGTRPNRAFLEEVGFMHNLIETWGALEETNKDADFKNLVIYGLGTGGLTTQGAAVYAKEVYYNPEAFDCLMFEDEWEGRGKIGFFLPASMTRNKFKKTENLITDVEEAEQEIWKEREKAKAAGNLRKYMTTVINNPMKPSEIFLTEEGNFFQTAELKECQGKLEADKELLDNSWKVRFKIDVQGKVAWDFEKDKPPIRSFPPTRGTILDAPWEIFRHPVRDISGSIVPGRYIAGNDPVDNDGGVDTQHSLQSTFIMDSWTDEIVAEYTARTHLVDDYYEQMRLGLIYYNAQVNYENNKKGVYAYFKRMKSLHLLAETPEILRDKQMVKAAPIGNLAYGTTANPRINSWALELIKTWNETKAYHQVSEETELQNMHTIRSVALLAEMIGYSKEINCDRISAMGMLMIMRESKAMYARKTSKPKKSPGEDDFWLRAFSGKGKRFRRS